MGVKSHGMRRTKEYRVWAAMKSRCRDPREVHHAGKGIRVCRRWRKFENFFADMGPKPSPAHTLDRRNSRGNYTPKNCRWATVREQANNRSTNRMLIYQHQRMSLSDAVTCAGNVVSAGLARQRLERGWPSAAAVETPPRKGNYNRKEKS